MSDLQGNLQEIRQLVEHAAKADEERKKEAKIKYLENLRDSIALTAMEKLLLVVPVGSPEAERSNTVGPGDNYDGHNADLANRSYSIAEAMMNRRLFTPIKCGEGESKTAWHMGPPPVRDDGKMILVMIYSKSYDSNERWVFVVRCHAKGVSTFDGSELPYSSVSAWCEIPL